MAERRTRMRKPEEYGFRENAMLKATDVRVDPSYQRKVDQRQVHRIAAEMNPRLFGRLEVDIRSDGDYWVVDGQHRLMAAIQCGMEYVPCGVALSEGIEAEAGEFVELNRARRKVSGFDLFTARLTAGDPGAIAMSDIMHDHGYEMSLRMNKNSSSAVVSVETVYRDHGPTSLAYALQTFKAAYGTSEKIQGFMIIAIGRFYSRMSSRPGFNPARLATALRSVPISEIKRRTSERAGRGGVTSIVASYVLVDIYNKNLSAANRLSVEELY